MLLTKVQLYIRLKMKGGSVVQGAMKFNVLVTTFEMILSDLTMFRKISWKYAVIDEGHRLKNKVLLCVSKRKLRNVDSFVGKLQSVYAQAILYVF